MKVAIHVDAAQRPFNRVNHAILIAIQLLEMIMSEFRRLRATYGGGVGVRARVIPLRIFEHAVVDQIRPWLHDGFGRNLFVGFDHAMGFRIHWL